MDPDTFRGDIGVADPDVYWRRRVSVLTGVLVVVAVVVWACSQVSGGPDPHSGGKAGVVRRETPGPASARLLMPTPTARDPAERTATGARAGTRLIGRPGDPCDPADLMVHLQALREVFGDGAHPRFLLMLVNTGPVDCVADVGPRSLETLITSGSDRVWSTADCVAGDGARSHRLEHGIPYVRTIDWDRHRSGGDCGSPHPLARPGTYVAVAKTGALTSHKAVFLLR